MSNYTLNKSIVSQSEATALKEMIFQRARERANALTEDVQNSFTTSIQNDVMDLARNSFVANKNPFSQQEIVEQKNVEPKAVEPIETKSPEIGFSKRRVEEIKTQIKSRNNDVNATISTKEIESAMNEARVGLDKKTTFMGALDFLNSQASIALVKNRGKVFEALA